MPTVRQHVSCVVSEGAHRLQAHVVLIVAAVAILGLSPHECAAQGGRGNRPLSPRYEFVGYCFNAPASQWFGISAAMVHSHAPGIFASLLVATPVSDNVYDNISERLADSWGDRITDESQRSVSGNIGLVYGLSPAIAIYAGPGFSIENSYQQRYDPMHILGTAGNYWIKVDDGFRFNAAAGVLARVSARVVIQGGYSSNPAGAVIGVGAALSRPERPRKPRDVEDLEERRERARRH